MKVSAVIKSIKTSPSDWAMILNQDNGIVFQSGDFFFYRHKKGNKGFRIKSSLHNVDMYYSEEDVIGRQLCMYLVNNFNNKAN